VRELAVLSEFCKAPEWFRPSLQHVFSQPAKMCRHLHKGILLGLTAIACEQLKLGATEVARCEMALNVITVFRD